MIKYLYKPYFQVQNQCEKQQQKTKLIYCRRLKKKCQDKITDDNKQFSPLSDIFQF